MEKKKSSKAVVVILISLLVLALLWIGVALGLYTIYFGRRFETNKAFMYHAESFEGLERTRYEFPSDKGQNIVGYISHKTDIMFSLTMPQEMMRAAEKG